MKRDSFLKNIFFLFVLAVLFVNASKGQNIEIVSVQGNGVLTWEHSDIEEKNFQIEWASSLDGPWMSSWNTLSGIVPTGSVMSASVPMFFRVVQIDQTPPSNILVQNEFQGIIIEDILSYSGTLSNSPIVPGSLAIRFYNDDDQLITVAVDNGNGGFVGGINGTIIYMSGMWYYEYMQSFAYSGYITASYTYMNESPPSTFHVQNEFQMEISEENYFISGMLSNSPIWPGSLSLHFYADDGQLITVAVDNGIGGFLGYNEGAISYMSGGWTIRLPHSFSGYITASYMCYDPATTTLPGSDEDQGYFNANQTQFAGSLSRIPRAGSLRLRFYNNNDMLIATFTDNTEGRFVGHDANSFIHYSQRAWTLSFTLSPFLEAGYIRADYQLGGQEGGGVD